MKKTIQFFLSCCLVLLFSAAQADKLRIEYKYDPLGNVVEEKHLTAGGAEISRITHSYDGLGRLKKSSDQLGVLREVIAYDAQGNVKHEKDGAGRSSYFEYDGLGRVEKISDDEGTIRTILEYDGKGNVLREKDGKGTESVHEYDHRGHLIKTTKAGITQEWKYDKNGNLEWETDGEGRKTRYEYDGLNRIKVVTDPAGNKQKTDYSVGSSQSKTVEVATTTDAENRVTIRKSDGRGRVLESIMVGEHGDEITFSKYNEANLLIQQTLPEGNEISYGYNARNLLTSASSNGSSATLGYDVAGNLKSRTDGGGNVTVYQYDARNRRTDVIYADGVKETAQYDLGDLLKQTVDANGVQTDISYDSRGREEKRTLSRGGAIKQTIEIAGYDANNNITQRIHNVAGKTYNESAQYDAHNRVTTRTDSNGETFNFSYTKDHQQKSVTSKAGTSQYSYNTVGLLKDIDGSVSYSYYNNGLTDTITYADGSTTKHLYDKSNRLKSIETKRDGTLIESAEYRYDKNGNRDYEKTVQGGKTIVTDGFTYDEGDRLTHFTETTTINGTSTVKTTAYAYDGAGNRTSETVSGSENYSKSYTPNKRNQIKQISENGSTTNFYYDKAGNLRQKKNETANRMFHWNESGDLIQVAEKAGETFRSIADYAYNADGLRIQKTNRQFQRNTSWLGNQALLDLDANKNLEASYEFGPNGRTAVLRKDADGTTEQLYADGMGSISATSSDTGTSYTTYDPFGNAEKSGANSKNKFGFTGHESDDETGLVYAKARYYDPQLGRFISRDAFEGHGNLPASWNAYQYAYNNPFVYVDPDGNFPALSSLKELFGFSKAFQLEQTENFGNNKVVAIGGSIAVGGSYGVTSVLEGITGGVNYGANSLVAAPVMGFYDQLGWEHPEWVRNSVEELRQSNEGIGNTYIALKQAGVRGTSAQISENIAGTFFDINHGFPEQRNRAIVGITGTIVEAFAPSTAAYVAGKAGLKGAVNAVKELFPETSQIRAINNAMNRELAAVTHADVIHPQMLKGQISSFVEQVAPAPQFSVFNILSKNMTINLSSPAEQAIFLSRNVPGLSEAQATRILEAVYPKNSSVVIGGSRVRGNYVPGSDLDVGFGNLNVNQTGKIIKKLNKSPNSGLSLEKTVIVPGNKTDIIEEIISPEEFFQRSGTRGVNDTYAGEKFFPSGSITLEPDGRIIINPPRKP